MKLQRSASELLREWRGERTQIEASALLGVSQTALSDYESGKKIPGLDVAFRIEEVTKRRVRAAMWRTKKAA